MQTVQMVKQKERLIEVNKKELVCEMAQKSGLSQRDAERALDTFAETAVEAMEKGQNVQLIGFGSFGVSYRKARIGKNPKTGETLEIPAKKIPVFKAGKKLKDRIR